MADRTYREVLERLVAALDGLEEDLVRQKVDLERAKLVDDELIEAHAAARDLLAERSVG